MSRPSSGKEVSAKSKGYWDKARTSEESQQAQAFVFPLEFGFTLIQAGQAIGKLVRWTSQMRSDFIRTKGGRSSSTSCRGRTPSSEYDTGRKAEFKLLFFMEQKKLGFLSAV